MLHWHTDVEQEPMARLIFENLQEHMPGVRIDVVLQEVVKAAVATDLSSINTVLLQAFEGYGVELYKRVCGTHLKLRSDPKACALDFRSLYTSLYASQIALPIKRPLIQRA